jgi:hypothetical protein
MSYAEQHIFLSNRALTPKDREHADSLSSHAVVGSNYAIYTYVYGGSFKGNEQKMLSKTFDAMLWHDSSECFHLRFRFPKDVVPLKELKPYLSKIEFPAIEVETVSAGKNTILSIRCHIEDGERAWIEDTTQPLLDLMPIREDILAGDYRALYLIARYNQLIEEESDETTTDKNTAVIPLPPGLDDLPDHLISFGYQCGFDHEEIVGDLPKITPKTLPDFEHNLQFLDKKKMMYYLGGILNKEPDLAARLRRELAGFDAS